MLALVAQGSLVVESVVLVEQGAVELGADVVVVVVAVVIVCAVDRVTIVLKGVTGGRSGTGLSMDERLGQDWFCLTRGDDSSERLLGRPGLPLPPP